MAASRVETYRLGRPLTRKDVAESVLPARLSLVCGVRPMVALVSDDPSRQTHAQSLAANSHIATPAGQVSGRLGVVGRLDKR